MSKLTMLIATIAVASSAQTRAQSAPSEAELAGLVTDGYTNGGVQSGPETSPGRGPS